MEMMKSKYYDDDDDMQRHRACFGIAVYNF